jgi:hypothetical protein
MGDRFIKTGNRSEYWKRIVKKYGYVSEIIISGLTEEESYKKETEYICHYKSMGECGANFTDGGDGVRVQKRWWGNKISMATKGIKRPSGIKSKSYKNVLSKSQLMDYYINLKMSSTKIAEIVGVSYTTVIERLRQFNIPVRTCGKAKIKIKCTNDGKIFESINCAAEHYNVFRENIRKVLHGKYRQTGGKKFEYIRHNK